MRALPKERILRAAAGAPEALLHSSGFGEAPNTQRPEYASTDLNRKERSPTNWSAAPVERPINRIGQTERLRQKRVSQACIHDRPPHGVLHVARRPWQLQREVPRPE